VDCSGEGPSCGDGYCTPPETTDSCKKDCPSTCAQTGETVYGSANLGPTSCCKKNDGIKPSTSGGKTGMCTAPQNGSLGTCVAHWWKTCGDGECGEGEDICNCRNDCTCGNGKCEKGKGERKKNCPADCK
jgi:hypothetical protein